MFITGLSARKVATVMLTSS